MISIISQCVVIVACVVILSRSEPAIARMGRKTALTLRCAMHFLTVGAAWQIGAIIVFGDIPSIATVILVAGVASLLLCERRIRMMTGRMGRRRQDGVAL